MCIRKTHTLRFGAAVLMAVALLLPYQLASAQTCGFVLGFAGLHDQIPGIVGDCTENVHYDGVTGDGLQATTNGLMVWRKNDNLTAFTDGFQTWLDGPFGLQTRQDMQRFFWEPNTDNLSIVPTPRAGDQCSTAGTTIGVIGSDAGAGNVYATFGLSNILNVSCNFYGFVGAELRDANDNPLPTRVVRNGGPLSNRPPPTLVSVQPNGSAQFVIHWGQVPTGNETGCPASNSQAVILPDQYLPLRVPVMIHACNGGELDVTAVQPVGS